MPLLEIRSLTKVFPLGESIFGGGATGEVRAVDDVSLSIDSGETLGLVGESGSGKSTLGRLVLRLIEPTSGSIYFDGRDLLAAGSAEMRRLRRHLQIVFQDPFGSLDPRMRVEDIISEPLIIHKGMTRQETPDGSNRSARRVRVRELLRAVGLDESAAQRFPHEFSGGQRQRIVIARALALRPKFIVADEPVSALDVSVGAQVVNLLSNLQKQLGLTFLFIAHDLSVVRHISNRVAVMYVGKIVEIADRDQLYENPLHPYTQALLSAIPIPDPGVEARRKRIILTGDVPSPVNPPSGCRFHTRCPVAFERCKVEIPAFNEYEPGHRTACHWVEENNGKAPDLTRGPAVLI